MSDIVYVEGLNLRPWNLAEASGKQLLLIPQTRVCGNLLAKLRENLEIYSCSLEEPPLPQLNLLSHTK